MGRRRANLFATVALPLALALALPSCASVGHYFAARVRDTVDVAPVSIACGTGLLVRARVMNRFDFGIGKASCSRAGWRRRVPSAETRSDELARGGLVPWRDEKGWEFGWHEETKAVPFIYSLTDYARPDGDTRQAGTFFTVVPFRPPASVPSERTEAGSVCDIEGELFLGIIGIRAAVSPTQLFDWVAGWFCFDPLGDDEAVPCEPPSD